MEVDKLMRHNMCLQENVDYLSHAIPLRHLPPHPIELEREDHWRRVNRLPPYDIPLCPPPVLLVPQIFNEIPKKATKSVGTGEDPRVTELTKQLDLINKKLAQI